MYVRLHYPGFARTALILSAAAAALLGLAAFAGPAAI